MQLPRKHDIEVGGMPEWGPRVDILLDGVIQTAVVSFDCDVGTVCRLKKNEAGEISINGEEFLTEQLHGEITVRYRLAVMIDSPEMAAYRAARTDTYTLMNGGVFFAREVLPPVKVCHGVDDLSVIDGTVRIFQYAARRIGPTRYEVYNVETGEVVGGIN